MDNLKHQKIVKCAKEQKCDGDGCEKGEIRKGYKILKQTFEIDGKYITKYFCRKCSLKILYKNQEFLRGVNNG